jgi:acyl-CoA thioester hydrolase
MARSDFRFCFAKRVRFPEIDSQAVLFNSRYLEYFDLGVVEYWRSAGVFGGGGPLTGPHTHVAKAVAEFKAPILLDEKIDICVRCSRIGTTSLTFRFELHGFEKEDLRASGEEVYVHMTAARGRPSPVPANLIALFETYEGRVLVNAQAHTSG